MQRSSAGRERKWEWVVDIVWLFGELLDRRFYRMRL
jgi:hypothetical protein